jgi:hypothetical protein
MRMRNQLPYPVIRVTAGEGGSQELHREKDRGRGLVPGDGRGGSAGQIPAKAVPADRASVAADHVDGMKILPRIKRV